MTGSGIQLAAILWLTLGAAAPPNLSGRWIAAFDTQIGHQAYVYEFEQKGGTLKGTISSANGESPIQQGKVRGGTVTFLETFASHGMEIPTAYSGTIVSADEIRFVRRVGEFATEEFVATRVPPQLGVSRRLTPGRLAVESGVDAPRRWQGGTVRISHAADHRRASIAVSAQSAADPDAPPTDRRAGRSPASPGLRAREV